MGTIYYDIAAIIILGLNLFFFYNKKKVLAPKNLVFVILLYVSLFSAIFDILGVCVNINALSTSYPLLLSINSLYYLFHNSIPFLFGLYIMFMTGIIHGMPLVAKILFSVPWLLNFFLISLNPWARWLFYYDSLSVYSHGSLVPVLYLVGLFYSIYAIWGVIKTRKALPPRTVGSVLFFILVSFIPALIQYLYPDQLLQCLGFAISELFILLTIQSPDPYIYSDTGLFNRNGFAEQVGVFLRTHTRFTVALIAVSDVSFLRRTFGLEYFAQLIHETSFFFQRELGPDLIAARVGEAEFALILRYDSVRYSAQSVINALIERFKRPWLVDRNSITLSARFCVIKVPEESSEPSEIFRVLDQIKNKSGQTRNNYTAGITDLELADKKRGAVIERAINLGFEKNGFSVFYQPIFSAVDHRMVSAEALVRLKDDKLGYISPSEFIPISEHNGTIHRIGDFVFDSVCAFMREEKLVEKGVGFIEINLSVAQCVQADIVKKIMDMTKKRGIDANRICLEITETAAAGTTGKLVQTLRALAEAGYYLALDDFGTGYSNIKYLMELPFSHVKLDRSIVYSWFDSDSGRIMLESSVSMFKRMNIKIVAEGVESAEQAHAMTELGCDYLQGYYFSKPVSTENFMALLRDS